MSDVEKYGLVAVVFVGGLLLVIATQGGFGGKDAKALAPEVIDSATPMRSTPGKSGDNTVRVVSVLPDTPFQWNEPPVPYPGRRSAGQPAGAARGASDDSAVPVTPPLSMPSTKGAATNAATGSGAGTLAQPSTHVIAKGETLEDVAEKYLGAKSRWRELIAWNPGLDPRRLKIGQVVRVSASQPGASLAVTPKLVPAAQATGPAPAAPAPSAALASAAKSQTHTVVKGDTLGKIAKKYLGSATRADDIYKANTDVLKSKDALAVGQVLRIP